MSNPDRLLFNLHGEPFSMSPLDPIIVFKDDPSIRTPILDPDTGKGTLYVHPDFSQLVPHGARVVVPTGLMFEIQRQVLVQVSSIPRLMQRLGFMIVPQTFGSNEEIEVTMLNIGSEDLVVFGGMRIAEFFVVEIDPDVEFISEEVERRNFNQVWR